MIIVLYGITIVSVDLDTVNINVSKFSYGALILFFILLSSCERRVIKNQAATTNRFVIDTKSSTKFKLPETNSISEIIYLETLDSSVISQVDRLWISNDGSGDIFIFDSKLKKVFIFNSDGKVKSIFDKNGSGPGEYNEIRDVFIDFGSNEIHLLDYQRIKRYDLTDFRFLGDKDLRNLSGDSNFTRFIKIGGVYYLWTNIPPFQRTVHPLRNQRQQYHLVKLTDDKEEFFIEYQYGVLNEIRFYPTVRDDVFLLSPITGKNDVQMITEGGVIPKYEFSFSNKAVPHELLKEMFNLQNEFLTADYFKLLTNFRETESFLYFNYIGPDAKILHGLFDKRIEKIVSVGKHEEYIPQIAYSDSAFFYSVISPDVLFNSIKNKWINLSNNTLLGHVDLEKIKKDDNPLIVKFSIE